MIKTIRSIMQQDKERYKVPRRVQDVIPIKTIWADGIFKVGNSYAKTWRFSDVNYFVAGREDKERMFMGYAELLNSLDSAATIKLTIRNHSPNRANFEKSVLMPLKNDGLDKYRSKYGAAIVPFVNNFPKDTELYRLMTTKPGEGSFAGGDC